MTRKESSTPSLNAHDIWLSREQVAKRLNVSQGTVINYKLPYRQHTPRGKCFYRLSDVQAFKTQGFKGEMLR